VSLPLSIAYFERALGLVRTGGPEAVRAKYLDSLGNARLADHHPAAAVPPLEEAARIYQNRGLREDWARTEYNLGNVCCELAETGAPSMWEKAVRHYLSALRVRTEKSDAMRFAATVQNLGTAYRELPSGNRAANLRKAIGCYCAAFRVYTGAHMADKCADLHNNLGNAYLNLPDPPEASCKNIRRALRHYALALRVRTKIDRPHDYAVTQFNCGQGYLLLAACGSSESVQPAATCFRESLDVFLLCGDGTNTEMVAHRLEALDRVSSTAA
jgi:tetratricopeptide (TPR) repeat protein